MEEWKNIESFEGYQVSNEGRIKNSKGNILKCEKSCWGYLRVGLWKDGKQAHKQIHRLVAEAFLPNPQNLPQVNHKDENKQNNSAENLEWCNAEYNMNYGDRNKKISSKLSRRVDQIDKVTGEVVRQWESTNECGRNGFNQSCVSECAIGKLKTHKGYVWKYIQA